ncbi:MAG: FAD binding domain-containing protein [Bacteroidota bacterium]
MIRFILNNKVIQTDNPPGMLLLDFVRYHEHLMGTKIGCREGDCGACTVLLGELKGEKLQYRSVVSCLTALGNVHGKQVVTIEGLNREEGLNPLQQAVCDEGGAQCGFCTPGFIVSMAGFCRGKEEPSYKNALTAVDGNICRCSVLQPEPNGVFFHQQGGQFLGGGTDLYVQQHEQMVEKPIDFLFNREGLKGIVEEGDRCWIGGAATVSDLMESPVMQQAFPRLDQYARLISSTPIRNIATVAGNFVNASPIGDLSIFFLAMDARLVLSDGVATRELPLRELYRGYKVLAKGSEEFIEKIYFKKPGPGTLFHFEKVSKRTYLDIASVNTALRITVTGNRIVEAHLSAGGVGPIPGFLVGASAVMQGRKVEEGLVGDVIETAQREIAPISDTRGTASYKRRLLGQLIKAHFLTLFPGLEAARLL